MATSADYLAFVLEQLPPLWDVRSRKMFGEYMVYLNEKPVLLVCDNTVFVKKLPVFRSSCIKLFEALEFLQNTEDVSLKGTPAVQYVLKQIEK